MKSKEARKYIFSCLDDIAHVCSVGLLVKEIAQLNLTRLLTFTLNGSVQVYSKQPFFFLQKL